MIDEQETLRQAFKTVDYKLGDTDRQIRAVEVMGTIHARIKEREEQKVVDRLRIVTHLKAGGELEIDTSNQVEIDLFVRMKGEGLINILEPERKKFIAKWKQPTGE